MTSSELQNEWPPTRGQIAKWMASSPAAKDRAVLFLLYRSKCVWCGGVATDIHEALERSRGHKALDRMNRFTLCREHHTELQRNSIGHLPELRRRADRLLDFYWGKLDGA